MAERNQQIAEAYLAGASLADVGKMWNGLSRQRIHQILEQLGIKRRPVKRHEQSI